MFGQIYPHSSTPTSEHIRKQGLKGVFSKFANPDDDWTKISDLGERRRVQNRIAQRKYRNKVKRRLEDLDKRAGLSPALEDLQSSGPSNSSQQYPTRPDARLILPSQLTPVLFTCHTYPALEDFLYAAYGQPFCPMSTDYLAPVPDDTLNRLLATPWGERSKRERTN